MFSCVYHICIMHITSQMVSQISAIDTFSFVILRLQTATSKEEMQ